MLEGNTLTTGVTVLTTSVQGDSPKAMALWFKKMDGQANTALREHIFHEVS